MALGPTLIFDKSTLQSLNIDEACWLDNFFRSNITPLFFVETLADLEKETISTRSPEEIVGNISLKTPNIGSLPNVHHLTLCIRNLLGEEVEMRRVPIIARGIPVINGNKKGVFFKQSPELEAFQRWQRGEFLEVERQFAKLWRRALSRLDLEADYRKFQKLLKDRAKPQSLPELKDLVESLILEHYYLGTILNLAMSLLDIPHQIWPRILSRWKVYGYPKLEDFAPYANHVFKVELFFYLGIASDLISRERRSNKIDFAYLYYIPFCMIFVSNDNLHAKTVPLFLQDNQLFISGIELKIDLKKLDDYYSKLPNEVKNLGIIKFASYPPQKGDFLVSQIWDKFLPNWRSNAKKKGRISKKEAEKIIKEIRRFKERAKVKPSLVSIHLDNADSVIFERRVPARRGKWRIVPPEVEERSAKN